VDSTLELSPLADGSGIKLRGELDLLAAPRLAEALEENATESEVVLDLSELTFVDSAGLRVLFAFAGSRNGHGPLILLNPTASIERLLEITRVDRHPAIATRHSSPEEKLARR
jgi:anti-anti-sigma factor